MATNGMTRMANNGFSEWNSEDTIHYIKSFVESVVEFREVDGKRVIGTVDKCEENSFYLIATKINDQYFGDYVIHENEIRKWRLKRWKKTENQKHNKNQRPQRSSPDMSSEVLIPRMQRNGAEDNDYLSDEDLDFNPDLEKIDLNEDDDPIDVNLKPLNLKASNRIELIDKIDDKFDAIIESINRSKCIGFELFGEEIVRHGSVDWMAFAAEEAIYVFDANSEDIVKRLKPLLVSDDLQKVMFSSRLPSDALFHMFDIDLRNVRDIRNWDLKLQKQELQKRCAGNNIRKWAKPKLRSFGELLSYYFRIETPNLYRNLDYSHLSVRVQNMIRLKTIFLRELFAIIHYKLLADVFQTDQRCVRSLRSTTGLEFIAMKSDEREIEIIECPLNEFEQIEKQILNSSTIRPIMNGTDSYHRRNEQLIEVKPKTKTNKKIVEKS